MKRILLTGHTGFIGKEVKNYLVKNFEIIGLSRKCIASVNDIQLDLASDFTLENILTVIPDAIIHLAAQSNVNECENNPQETYLTNVRATLKLAKYAAKYNIHFVFASSDQVYCGSKEFYTENDEAYPLNEYGKQKLTSEQQVLSIYPKSVVLRFALVIGESGGYEKALVSNLNLGKQQTLFTDEIRSVIAVEDLCKGVKQALNWQGGVYNIGGNTALNRFEIARAIAKKHDLDVSLLIKGLQSDVKLLAQRPKNVTLNSNKAVKLGWVNNSIDKNYYQLKKPQ